MQFKIDLKRGKGVKRRGSGPMISGTPEEIHATMWPRIQKQREEGLKAEIAAAEAVTKSWEKRQKAMGRSVGHH